jgi:3-hydroxyacyl-[acyl-carrier-protein] dehydratase
MGAFMGVDEHLRRKILTAVPQQVPFRFIDEIIELDEEHIVGSYRFRKDEFFYRGHFPGRPITPGVILIETMAQTGVVAFGIYLTMVHNNLSLEQVKELTALFTLVETVEFLNTVYPGEKVIVRGEKKYFRRGSMKAKILMERENGQTVCFGTLAGMGIRLENV